MPAVNGQWVPLYGQPTTGPVTTVRPGVRYVPGMTLPTYTEGPVTPVTPGVRFTPSQGGVGGQFAQWSQQLLSSVNNTLRTAAPNAVPQQASGGISPILVLGLVALGAVYLLKDK